MSKEKQIEEMAKIIGIPCYKRIEEYGDGSQECPSPLPCNECTAELLYNAGYRKQEEGEWEIVKGSNGKEKMVCTNCRHQQDLASTFTYCPNCGAKMKGDKWK